MAENYSHLQKLCLDTIQQGAIGAFVELFRLTHMEQPLGNNQPQNFEDLIGTAGVEAPQLAPLFSFDSPLGMPLTQLQSLQQLLTLADKANLEQDQFTQFCALASLSDSFLQNHKLRLKVKMLPLVIPYPQYTQLLQSKLNNILHLIDSADFQRAVAEEDPLIAAVAKLRKQQIRTQTFPPITISYAIKARNCLYELIQREATDCDLTPLLPLLKDAEIAKVESAKPIPEPLLLRFLTMLLSCYLRLAISLQQFNLFRAAYQVFQLFLEATAQLELLLGARFSQKFQATERNGYKQFLSDEQINTNSEKKDDNLAYSSLELLQVPKLYDTILDRKCIFNHWEASLSLKQFTFVDRQLQQEVEAVTELNNAVGNAEQLCEFVYAGRQMAIINTIQLSCQIFTQQVQSLEDIDIDTTEAEQAIKAVCAEPQKELSVSQLSEPKLPKSVTCTYKEYVFAVSLARKALSLALDYNVFSVILPAFRRFSELVSLGNIYFIAKGFAEAVALVHPIFEIHSLAWRARWARLQGKNEERLELLTKRLECSKKSAIDDKSAVKYAVSAASELVFNSPGNNVNKMEEAWNDLQASQSVAQKTGNKVELEARVRYGAVKGAEVVSNSLHLNSNDNVEPANEADLDFIDTI